MDPHQHHHHHDQAACCGEDALEMPWNDPTLASCCARDMKNFHKAMKLKDLLTEHDPTTQNVRMRQQVIQLPPPPVSSSSGCSVHPHDVCGCAMSQLSLQQQNKDEEDDDEYDYLLDEGDDEDALDSETLRLMNMRRQQLQQQVQETLQNARDGFGVVTDSLNCREFVDQLQKEEVVPHVVYFHDQELAQPSSVRNGRTISRCSQSNLAIVHKQLLTFAQKFAGTKFLLVPLNLLRSQDRDIMHGWRINQLPALAAFKGAACRNVFYFEANSLQLRTSQKLSDQQDTIWEAVVLPWLDKCHVLERTRQDVVSDCPTGTHHAWSKTAASTRQEDGVLPQDHEYDCGVEGCRIRFAYEHEHIGPSKEAKEEISAWRRTN